MAERIIPFPFQKKELQDGEKLPIVDRAMEESKTLDKWQIVGGSLLAFVNPAAGAAIAGFSLVSHEVTRGELKRRQDKRRTERVQQELQKAA